MPLSEYLLEITSYIKNLNATTMFTIAVLVVLAGALLKYTMDSGLLTSVFVLSLQTGAFLLNFLCMKLNITLFSSPDANLIAISTLGMILGLVFVIVIMRSSIALADATRPSVKREGTSTLHSSIPRR